MSLLKEPISNNQPIVFIDIEASGLGSRSWPVEVGWVFLEGAASALLIKPESIWPDEAWDPDAERLHGLSRDHLHREGVAASEVCDRVNRALDGCLVFSDAPEWDAFWLYRLFGAVNKRPSFSINDFAELVRPFIAGRETTVLEAAVKEAPKRHRAAADALHLRALHRLACET